MTTPQIHFHHMDSTEALNDAIQAECERLMTYYSRTTHLRVVIEAPQRNVYEVHIDQRGPFGEIVVKYNARDEPYLVIREAFARARRQLQSKLSRLRSKQQQPRQDSQF